MIRFTTLAVSLLLLLACRKNINTPSSNSNFSINQLLKAELSDADYRRINWDKTRALSDFEFIIGLDPDRHFKNYVSLKIDSSGKIIRGYIIESSLQKMLPEKMLQKNINGQIHLYSLNRKIAQHGIIQGGRVFFDKSPSARLTDISSSGYMVIVPKKADNYYNESEFWDYLYLSSSWLDDDPYTSNFYFSSTQDYWSQPYYNRQQAYATNRSPYNYPPYYAATAGARSPYLLMDEAPSQYQRKALDMAKITDCFASVSDLGATCSIELCIDIPVDYHPDMILDWETLSPGHSFIILRKSNLGKTVTQNIGFYAAVPIAKAVSFDPVPCVLFDDGGREHNASIRMSLDAGQLAFLLKYIQVKASVGKYDLDEYNCTNFALDVFNMYRTPTNRLNVERIEVPGGEAVNGSIIPQGVYMLLDKIQRLKVAERPHISMHRYKSYSLKSMSCY